MNIKEIYKKYKIPHQLQLHQVRVTAVAKVIVDNWIGEDDLDEDLVLKACLMHDMGNIIKFNLELYPETLEPEGYDYWKAVQDEFIDKYGNDEHQATLKIAKELEMEDSILEMLSGWGFSNGMETIKLGNFESKIAYYADQRIEIDGVKSMEERHKKGRERYRKRKGFKHLTDKDQFEKLVKSWQEIEKQIFNNCDIAPEEVTDEKINPIIEKLWTKNL